MLEQGLINEGHIVSRCQIVEFYRDQLLKFETIGIGKETEHGTKITKILIATTKKRLKQLI